MANLVGMGRVDDLHYSMMKNGELKSLITHFSESLSRDDQLEVMDKIIATWAYTDNSKWLADSSVQLNVRYQVTIHIQGNQYMTSTVFSS